MRYFKGGRIEMCPERQQMGRIEYPEGWSFLLKHQYKPTQTLTAEHLKDFLIFLKPASLPFPQSRLNFQKWKNSHFTLFG